MATEILVTVAPLARLAPLTAGDQETLLGMKVGSQWLAVLKSAKPRSIKQNRFYWGLLKKVVDNTDLYHRAEQLHIWMKVKLGYVEEIQFHDGKIITKVSSTSFERMASDEFKKYLDAVIAVICAEIIPGLDQNTLIREIEAMLGMSYEGLWMEKAA